MSAETLMLIAGAGLVFAAGLVTGCYFAARHELDRERYRAELHRKYGRRVS